jgi:predicted RNA-binding protein with PUA domain
LYYIDKIDEIIFKTNIIGKITLKPKKKGFALKIQLEKLQICGKKFSLPGVFILEKSKLSPSC